MATEHLNWHIASEVKKYRDLSEEEQSLSGDELEALGVQPYEVYEGNGNILLNEGIQLLESLLIGAGGTPFSNANARIGLGDSSAAAVATQATLQAASNKAYKAMDALYPLHSGQTLTFRSTFGTSEANFNWAEWTISNAATDAGTNLNRRVQAMGTKDATMTWVMTATLTIT